MLSNRPEWSPAATTSLRGVMDIISPDLSSKSKLAGRNWLVEQCEWHTVLHGRRIVTTEDVEAVVMSVIGGEEQPSERR